MLLTPALSRRERVKTLDSNDGRRQKVSQSAAFNQPVVERLPIPESLRLMQGSMSLAKSGNPGALERANYMRILQSWRA